MKKKLRRLVYNSLYVAIVLSILQGCNEHKEHHFKIFSMSLFDVSIDTVGAIKVITSEDSIGHHGFIFVKNIDTIMFNFGYDVNNLAEHDPAVFVFPYPTDTIKLDTSIVDLKDVVYTDKPNFDISASSF